MNFQIEYNESGFGGRKWTVEVGPIGVVGQQFATKKAALAACNEAQAAHEIFMAKARELMK